MLIDQLIGTVSFFKDSHLWLHRGENLEVRPLKSSCKVQITLFGWCKGTANYSNSDKIHCTIFLRDFQRNKFEPPMYPFSFFSSKIPLVIIGKKKRMGGKWIMYCWRLIVKRIPVYKGQNNCELTHNTVQTTHEDQF